MLVLLVVWVALLAAGVLAGLAVEGNAIDGRLVRAVAADRTASLTSAARLGTQLGSGWLLVGGAVVAAALLLAGHPRRALVLVVALAGAALLGDADKLILERPRPAAGGRLVGVESSSWPSGHATTTAAGFGALAAVCRRGRFRAVVAGLALALVLAVGASRVYLGVHYPSDVLAGWTLGGLWLAGVLVVLGGGGSSPRAAQIPG